MSTPTLDPARVAHFACPVHKQRLPDGRWVVVPGEPVMRCRTAEAVRITGIPSKTLHRLADAGIIRRAKVAPNIVFWWPGEIEAVIEKAARDESWARWVSFAADVKREELARH